MIQRSDVVFMYDADEATYTAYAATVLAWGGRPRAESPASRLGVKVFGSVGMVTEFSRYHDRWPDRYEEGLCRDVRGQPVKVPWLTDHQHKGIPYWWCCTRQPLFRQYLEERVVETVKAGAHGVHIDDHMGTSGGLWLGLCFCDRCVSEFRGHLQSLPRATLEQVGIAEPATYDFRAAMRQWLAEAPANARQPPQHPLWREWTVYQCRGAATFMAALRDLASRTAGRSVPMGANAGLLWPNHLVDYRVLDLFSAETDHHAAVRALSDAPVLAYRMADAVGRPYAATASGGDWAFIKEHNLPGLVRGWIALGYAAGHGLMAPHRQWCYTPEKGTHWYQGPADQFAPLYRFVRKQARWFDGYTNHADVTVVLPYGSFARQPDRWIELNHQLVSSNVSYRIALAGDAVVDHPLKAGDLAAARVCLVPDRSDLLPEDSAALERHPAGQQRFSSMASLMPAVRPAVRLGASVPVRLFPRVKPGSAVIHLVNFDYDPARDAVRPVQGVRLALDLPGLGLPPGVSVRWVSPDGPEVVLALRDGVVELPPLGLWALVVLEEAARPGV